MSLKASFGLVACPDCGGMLHYSGIEEIEIYDAECMHCHKKWQVVKSPDGRKETREKTIN